MPPRVPFANGPLKPSQARVRPASADKTSTRRGAALGAPKKRQPARTGQAEAGPASSAWQAAQGATLAAATAVQGFWEGRDSFAAPALPDVQPLVAAVSQWLPFQERSNSEPLEAERARAASLEIKERQALQRLKEQADSNAAVQLLRRRASEGSLPGQRRDGFKLGLVVEGGGMRGAVSGGALQALHDLGLRDCFDAVYGSSAGAINATYFLSGQREGVDIYSQDITNTNFIDLRRLLGNKDAADHRPALDLSYLLDYIMNEVKPLDWQAVVDSPIPLKIVASCLDTLEPVLLSAFEDASDLRECLRASAAVPEVAGPPILHRGRRLVDAAVFEAIPFRAAIADGCTHILALPTRPPYKRGDMFGKWVDDTVAAIVKRAVLSPAYMQKAWVREVEYQRAHGVTPEELLVKSMEPLAHLQKGMEGCFAFPFFPGAAASYSPLCIDAATIMLGIADGRAAIQKILGVPASKKAPPARPALKEAPRPAPAIAKFAGGR